jgi:hypothetical protein
MRRDRQTEKQATYTKNVTVTFTNIFAKVPKWYGGRRMGNQWTIKDYDLLYRHTELFISILFTGLLLIYLFIYLSIYLFIYCKLI